jgi:DNA mismatch repair protein MutS
MSLTPMMRQYEEAKAQHPGMLLLFRMGDFYELFGADAERAARLLQLTLTSRDKQIPMAGFPFHALEGHLRRLLAAGEKVAICEQVEEPAQAKGLVRREVVRVVTPGTLTDDALLEPKQANRLAAAWPSGPRVGLAWLELASGKLQTQEVAAERLAEKLQHLEAAELLWPESVPPPLTEPALCITLRPRATFDLRRAQRDLQAHFQVQTLEGFGIRDDALAVTAAGALLGYLRETLKGSVHHLTRMEPVHDEQFMYLDPSTRRGLELTRTQRDERREGSLLSCLDRTATAMGARLLAEWLHAPLLDLERIRSRQAAVDEFVRQPAWRRQVRAELDGLPDLARLVTRISTDRASPRDLASLRVVLDRMPRLRTTLATATAPLLVELTRRLHEGAELRALLAAALVDQPPLSPKEGGLIRPGYHPELDDLREIATSGKTWIARFQAQEIARTGIQSLKVGFNRVFGYYLEVTHAQAAKVPPDYQRKQTLKNAERYITPELKEYEDKVLRAEDRAMALEFEIFRGLRERAAAETIPLLDAAESLATLDVLLTFAELAERWRWVAPELTTEPVCVIDQGRHPVLEQTLPAAAFVPNDTHLGGSEGRLMLLTGPNMAGKSTYIRQVALIAILAQMGSFVPARAARLGLVDRIFSRIGAGDDLARGQSTFMVEMAETANLLHHATPRSLVILDEVGRGTSTYDGLALAWAIVEHLHDQIGCRTLFATHYHELTQLAGSLPGVRNWNVAVHDDGGAVTFLHRVVPGPASRSYGIHVAQLAGVPAAVVQRAEQVLRQLEEQYALAALATESSRRQRRKQNPRQPLLFGSVE